MHDPAVPLILAALAAFAAACSPAQPVAAAPVAELAGRTAGPAQRCVPIIPGDALHLTEGQTEVLAYGTGRTIWINRLRSNCAGLDRDDTLVVQSIGSQYCRGDQVRSFDPVTRITGASCILGDFVPYSR